MTNIKDDTWYTMCLPVDLTKDQVEATFGSGTDLCDFSAVTYDESSKTITLAFTSPRYTSATDPVTVVAQANHSYMIHPATAPATGNAEISFRIIGVTSVTASNDNLVATTVNNASLGDFQFKGNYSSDAKIPSGYYFLGVKNGVCKYYREPASQTTTWKTYTACVIPPSGYAGAKSMCVSLLDDVDNQTTVIAGVHGTSRVDMNRIFNINGQLVRSSSESVDSLQTGLYIINGKKYRIK